MIKLSKELTYGEIFDLSGISNKLNDISLEITDLDEPYTRLFYKNIKLFLNKPLFKDIDLNNPKDLKFLKESEEFQEFLKKVFLKIEEKLNKKYKKTKDLINNFSDKGIVQVSDILAKTKINLVSLMFILNKLKRDGEIYDFNAKNITLSR